MHEVDNEVEVCSAVQCNVCSIMQCGKAYYNVWNTWKSRTEFLSCVELKFLFRFRTNSRSWCLTSGRALSSIQKSASPFIQSGIHRTDSARMSFDEKLFGTFNSKSWPQFISISEKESCSLWSVTLLSPRNLAVSSSKSWSLWYSSTVWIDPAILCSCMPSEPKLDILKASKYCSSRVDIIADIECNF